MQTQTVLALVSVVWTVSPAFADPILKHGAGFPEIKPHSGPVSQPVVKLFSLPGPDRFRVTVTYSPWYRVTNEQFKWRSTVPIDGRDFGGWVEFIPGAIYDGASDRSVPYPWVDGAGLVKTFDFTVRHAQPGMQATIYPPVVRFGDGSAHQLPSSASVVIDSIPDRDGSG
jgi:hypothetical protein